MLQSVSKLGARVIVVIGVSIAAIVSVTFLLSLQPFRDHLRTRYGFEPPEYYDKLPADTDSNRATIVELLAERDRDKAALEQATKPKPNLESSHGRTDPYAMGIVPDGPPYEPAVSLADGYELEQRACHFDWGLLDRLFDLCHSVDSSARAAEHYADDVENYWIPRLRPEPIVPPPAAIPFKE